MLIPLQVASVADVLTPGEAALYGALGAALWVLIRLWRHLQVPLIKHAITWKEGTYWFTEGIFIVVGATVVWLYHKEMACLGEMQAAVLGAFAAPFFEGAVPTVAKALRGSARGDAT